jgi:hypothetical protein
MGSGLALGARHRNKDLQGRKVPFCTDLNTKRGTRNRSEIAAFLRSRRASEARRKMRAASAAARHSIEGELPMGRSILLWLLGVPIPIIILIALFWH